MKQLINWRQKIVLLLLGMFLSLVILEALLRLGGFFYIFARDVRNKTSLSTFDPFQYRILCIGESTTALGGKDSYPAQLEKILQERVGAVHCKTINRAVPGTDTDAIVSELEYNLVKFKPHMIISMMGINDDAGFFEPKVEGQLVHGIRGGKDFIKSLRAYKLLRLIFRRALFKKALGEMCVSRAREYLDNKHYQEASKMLNEAFILNPHDPFSYILMGRCFYEQERYDEAKTYLNKAETLSLHDESALMELGWCYYDVGDFLKAEGLFQKAVKIKPRDQDIYAEFAQLYISEKLFTQAESMFLEAISLAPEQHDLYLDLGLCYFEQGRLDEAECLLKEALVLSKGDLIVSRYLGFIKEAQGRPAEAKTYFEKASSVMEKAESMTRKNYMKLKEIAQSRNIALVCVQYPMRKVQDLKSLFQEGAGIIFVDNETVFKDAVNKERFEDYFQDRFGGDFGHCTPKGNRLLAENIADVLVKEVFNKRL